MPLKLGDIGQEVLATALKSRRGPGGAEVHVVHVVRVPMSLPLDAPDQDEEEDGREALEEAREIAEELGVEVDGPRRAGPVAGAGDLDEAEAIARRPDRAGLGAPLAPPVALLQPHR